MKLSLLSMAGLFLLTGCDNFQLLKPSSKNNPRIFTIDHRDMAPSESNSNQNGTTPTAGTITTKPAIPSNNSTPTAVPTPAAPKPVDSTTVAAPAATQPVTLEIKSPPPIPAPAPSPVPKTQPEATAATKPPETSSTPEKPKAQIAPQASNSSQLNLAEFINLRSVIDKNLNEETVKLVTRRELPSGTELSDYAVEISGNYKDFSYKVSHKGQLVAEFKNLKLKLMNNNVFKEKDYELLAICSGAQCEVVFVSVMKLDEKRKIIENYPVRAKLVDGKYVIATYKTDEEYSAERNAAGNNEIALVPQLKVKQNLEQFIEARGQDVLGFLKDYLEKNKDTSYANQILFGKNVRPQSFLPIIARENGNLTVSAKIDYLGPQKPTEFRGLIQEQGASKPIASGTGLSLNSIALVKNQMFAFIIEKDKHTSKLAGVQKAIITSLCSHVEEKGESFTQCRDIEAALIFANEKVVEGSASGVIEE